MYTDLSLYYHVSLFTEYNTLDKLQLLALHQCVSTLAPWTDGPSVPSKYLESAIEINGTHHTNFPLLSSLAHGLGDHTYIMNGVYTKLGHFVGKYSELIKVIEHCYIFEFFNFTDLQHFKFYLQIEGHKIRWTY